MSAHDKTLDLLTDDARPRTRACAGADRNGSRSGSGSLVQTPLLPSVIPRSGTNAARETIAMAEYDALHRQLEDMAGELAAARTALTREHNANTRLRNKLEEIQQIQEGDDGAKAIPNADVILKFLAWWRDFTDRPANTRIDLTSDRATRTRRALKHYTPQELCWMVIGMCRDEWYVQHEKTDIKHMLKDEAIAERFLKLGRPRDEA